MRYFSILFMFVFSVVLTWTLWPLALAGWAGAYETFREQSYAETQGALTESRMQDGYWAVRYAYIVDGRRHESELAYDAASALGVEPGQEAAQPGAHPAGSSVTVHYDPLRPERAVLDPVTHGSEAVTWLLSLSVTAFIFLAWGALATLLMYSKREIVVGGCQVSTGPTGATHVRMPAVSPLYLGGVLALFLPFASVFVTFIGALPFGGQISFAAVMVVFAVVAAIIIGFPIRLWVRPRAAAHDLVIDSTNVTLPATHGRIHPLTRKRADIQDIGVDEARGSRRASRFYVSLAFANGPAERIAAYSGDWERAEALANWLGQKLGKPVTLSWTIGSPSKAA
ncbi:DUF3592 domain-containing protein [Terricaulis sp.]|uniref:DUF3592 domain-containing protein n=1 Tax=Terricaulis sp. TaxID=2768686 RepID=UPI0037833FFF